MLGSATAETYGLALPLLLADSYVDSVIVLFVPPVIAGADEVAAAVVGAAESAGKEKPVLAAILSEGGMPPALHGTSSIAVFPYPESAAHALGLATQRAEWLRRPAGGVPTVDGVDAPGGSGGRGGSSRGGRGAVA